MLVEQRARGAEAAATECADVEDVRARQSECVVNVHALQLRARLAALHLDAAVCDGNDNGTACAHRRRRLRRDSADGTANDRSDHKDDGSRVSSSSSSGVSNNGEGRGGAHEMPRNVMAALPAVVLQRLLAQLDALARDEAAAVARVAAHEAHARQLQQRDDEVAEQVERAKSAVSFLSEKSSAELQRFRAHLQQTTLWSREHTKEMADVRRQQERAENELRRAEMELTRLRNMAKRVQ